MEGYHAEEDTCVEDTPALTCDAEAHKEPNEAGTECVCMEGFVADGDNCVAPKCLRIANGDFSGTWTEGTPKSWTKEGTDVTFSNVEGALKIQSNYSKNQKILKSAYMASSADAEVPAGIKFKIAAPKASSISINLFWQDFAQNYYVYNWNPTNKVFEYAGDEDPRQHDYNTLINFGDSDFHETYIVFGPEITEDIWRSKEQLHIVFRAGKDVDSEIIVDDFELVYYGGECNNVSGGPYSIGYAHTQWPLTVNADLGTKTTFYGRVYIAGLTDATVNKSEFMMGVRAQFGIRPKDADMDYEWLDALVNTANGDSGNDDEYMYEYTFLSAGTFEYSFRFSADNGASWHRADNSGTATITSNPIVQIANADFSAWTDGENPAPESWVAKDATLAKADLGEGNYALNATHASTNSNGFAFNSPEFMTAADAKVPTALNFKLATDRTSKISINLNCGTTLNYNWNTTNKIFAKEGNNQYRVVDLGDTDMHQMSIDLTTSVDAAFWQGKTCKIEFKYGKNAAYDITVDDFQFVYPED